MKSDLSRVFLSGLAAEIFADENSWFFKNLQKYRPYVCPFDKLLDKLDNNSRVLDMGCGCGLFLLLAGKLGKVDNSIGIDISNSAIGVAKAAAGRANLDAQLHFIAQPAEESVPEGIWDFVTAIDLIHHLPRNGQRVFIEKLCDLTPSGGQLLIKDMVTRPIWRAAANQLHDMVLARQWVNQISSSEVASWIKAKGFRVVDESIQNTLWYGHWLVVAERKV